MLLRSRAARPSTPSTSRPLLEEAVAGVDPAEVVSLAEALERPGGAAYSPEARERFARLAAELRALRRHPGDPLLDLLHRVLATTGLDVEVGAGAARAGHPAFRGAGVASSTTPRRSPTSTATPECGRSSPSSRPAEEFDRGLDTAAPTHRRHGEAHDRAQGQGPGVADRGRARRHQRGLPLGPGPVVLGHRAGRRSPPACAATRATSRPLPSGRRRDWRPTRTPCVPSTSWRNVGSPTSR